MRAWQSDYSWEREKRARRFCLAVGLVLLLVAWVLL
jgi:hypothetical protein